MLVVLLVVVGVCAGGGAGAGAAAAASASVAVLRFCCTVSQLIFGAYSFSAILGLVMFGGKCVPGIRPKFCFARFSVTVYTGGSSTGRTFDAAEMGYS